MWLRSAVSHQVFGRKLREIVISLRSLPQKALHAFVLHIMYAGAAFPSEEHYPGGLPASKRRRHQLASEKMAFRYFLCGEFVCRTAFEKLVSCSDGVLESVSAELRRRPFFLPNTKDSQKGHRSPGKAAEVVRFLRQFAAANGYPCF